MMLYLLIGYMWLFIHRPFEIWPWLGEMRIERAYMLVTILFWLFCAEKKWTANRINWGIGFFAVAMILSTAFSPYTDFSSLAVQNWFKVALFYVMVMSSVHKERELQILIIAFVAIMGLYELHSLREYFNGRHVYRMGTARMVGVDATMNNPNAFGATAAFAIPMLLPVVLIAKKHWQRLAILGLFVLACVCILLTGSRSAFVGLGFQVVVLGFFSKHRGKIFFLLLVALPVTWTLLPEDRQNRYMTLIDPSRGPANAQESAEGRMLGFLNGIELWKKSPIVGVGPACHGKAIGHGFRSHNLYGQVLGNYGTLGTLALLIIVYCYFANFAEARRLYQQLEPERDIAFLYRTCGMVAFVAILLLLFGWSGHNLLRYTWLWYAAFQSLSIRFLRARVSETEQMVHQENTLPYMGSAIYT